MKKKKQLLVSVSELQEDEQRKKQIRKETYSKILDMISKKIKAKNELGEKRLIFVTPSFVMGCPSFDVGAATVYLERQIRNGGYNTAILSNDSFYIDWMPKSSARGTNSHGTGSRGTNSKSRTERDVLEDEYSGLINLKKYAEKYK